MPIQNSTHFTRRILQLSSVPLTLLFVSSAVATGIPEGWDRHFSENLGHVQVLTQEEAGQIQGALGPAAVLIPMAVGAAIGSGSYLAGSNNPSVEGSLIAGAFGAVAGGAALLPTVPAAIVGGAAGIGGASVTNIIDSRPVSPYGSFPPGIGSAGNCTPWTCGWKDGQPVPLGTPGSIQ